MTLISEQLSAVRKSQWESQLDVVRSLSSRALDSTEQLIALNLKASRTSVEQAAGAFKQILEAREPRDLFAVTASVQDQWQQFFSYGQELLGIATGKGLRLWTPEQLASMSAPQVLEQAAIAVSAGATMASEIAAAASETNDALVQATLYAASTPAAAPEAAPEAAPAPAVTELDAETAGAAPSEAPREESKDDAPARQEAVSLVVETQPTQAANEAGAADAIIEAALADDVPPGRTTTLVRAMNEAAPQPAAVHSFMSAVPEANSHVDMPIVLPVDSVAPPQPQARVREAKPARASRKK